jgi:hypothetical protein
MNDNTDRPGENSLTGRQSWLRSTVTLTLPGWVFAAGALALLLIVIVALD